MRWKGKKRKAMPFSYKKGYINKFPLNKPLVFWAMIWIGIVGIPSSLNTATIALPDIQSDQPHLWLPIVTNHAIQISYHSEWAQEAHDPQRTGFTMEEPIQPWSLIWTWNGPDQSGGTDGHFYNAPREAHSITGGKYVYVPAGRHGLFALGKKDGKLAWHIDSPGFNSTPAYDINSGFLYAGGNDGNLYKIETSSGEILATYSTGWPINKSVLLVGSHVYVVNDAGKLHKVDKINMSKVWVYEAGSNVATPPSYSNTESLIVFCTEDLFVHAVNDSNGKSRWRVKPTINPARQPYSFEGYWPVIAERHGLVFVRLNLGMDGLWSGPGPKHIYPNTNIETRNYLKASPQLMNLFALNLKDGREAWIPAVGYGGVESIVDNKISAESGPVPVIKSFPDGTEVAYIPFRSGQGDPLDWRSDSHLGEMVLDNRTISGMEAGDLRFVEFNNSKIYLTDEQTPLSIAGNTIFHAHWGASESVEILNRSRNFGLIKNNPIPSRPNPTIIRRIDACSDFNPITHWTNCGLNLFDDGKYWDGPGWWVYWNVLDPPTPHSHTYSGGILPRYTYVSDGLIIVEGNGGDLFVLEHHGAQIQDYRTKKCSN